ncbi:hypothetical protein JW935_20730 [candidate division KSB1 bacterium]|nr:hypothetical protein [candidate division KSB1 bacterium]
MKKVFSRSPLIVGSTTIDFIEQKGRRTVQAGGVVNYAGYTFLKLGFAPVLLTNVNKADLQKFRLFSHPDIALFAGEASFTTNFINILDGEKRQQWVHQHANPIGAPAGCNLSRFNHIHLGPLFPEDISQGFIQAIPADTFVSLDIQGYTRKITANGRVEYQVSPRLTETLSKASVIKASEFELDLALKYFNCTTKTFMTQFSIREVLMTTGPTGGHLYHQRGDMAYSAGKVDNVVDPTGAGDVFFASYLHSKYYKKTSDREALDFAAGIAARQISGRFIAAEELKV